jgi:hypothetical protein
MDGKAHSHGTKSDLTGPEAEFIVSFAVDLVCQVENRVSDLVKPFGLEHWY